MEENYIIGLMVIFLFSFVLFKKDKTATEAVSKPAIKSRENNFGATGVARYLNNQDDASNEASGVAKYLQAKEALNAEIAESTAISGVAKYLANRAETPVSGVSKYMARQAVHAKKMAKENVSGVEKYLNNRG
jgi:oligoendopeptidase F